MPPFLWGDILCTKIGLNAHLHVHQILHMFTTNENKTFSHYQLKKRSTIRKNKIHTYIAFAWDENSNNQRYCFCTTKFSEALHSKSAKPLVLTVLTVPWFLWFYTVSYSLYIYLNQAAI